MYYKDVLVKKSYLITFLFIMIVAFMAVTSPSNISANTTVEIRERLTLTEPTHLHDSAYSTRQVSLIQPQTVTATAQNGSWFRINTWLGPKWINPRNAVPSEITATSKQLTLTRTTSLYNQTMSNTKISSSVNPQTVRVTGQWGNWYRINTWLGSKWIQPVDPRPANVETVSERLTLTEVTRLYDQPFSNKRISSSVNPQTVTVTGKWGEWYRINTWLGAKWIKPTNAVPYNIEEINRSSVLLQTAHLHNQPLAGSKTSTTVQPQVVTVTGQWGEWYRINTWQGPKWIEGRTISSTPITEISQQLTLEHAVPLHNHPITSTKQNNEVKPQTVNVIAKWGEWYRINTWLGLKWINPNIVVISQTEKKYGIVKVNSTLNVRSGPGSSHPVIGALANGTSVTIINELNGWYQIEFSNHNGAAYVSADFIEIQSHSANGKYTVFIDAGHGGTDPGALGRVSTEANLVLSISNKIINLLENDPTINVHYSRKDDSTVALGDRPKLANAVNADLFLSVHANAATGTATGTETWMSKSIDRPFAEIVHQHLIKATGLRDRGLKTSSFRVLRDTNMPAALIEVGFIDNPSEETLLLNNNFQNRVATAMYNAIKEYLEK
ncbi:N-acetylmuramoyl-L-alanine amidase [Alkalihalobacterium alkalinitrilicum]|uniref:N-acetylmuramoyl-L-alanine amidase n=1 Tax=Alkalihalobacterium alkalinitrilicum TaxID=427920 RepID=UPI000994C968|nr:N-acetylmuramoyl-L-alanine amidase [Alkalihalobacterium alkalinitrilicum]